MTMVVRPPERPASTLIWAKMCAAARPSLSAVSAVTGSMFAVPRTPSVPKILRPPLPFSALGVGLFFGAAINTEIDFAFPVGGLGELELKARRRAGRYHSLMNDQPQ